MTMLTAPQTDLATTTEERIAAIEHERARVAAGGMPRHDACVMTWVARMSAMTEDDDGFGRIHSDDEAEWGWWMAPRFSSLAAASAFAMEQAADATKTTLTRQALLRDYDDVHDLRWEVVESRLSVRDDEPGRVMLSVACDEGVMPL